MKTEEEIIFEQYFLILEKDHRQKMIKFGIPQEVADFLHEFNSKYSIWFANEFKKMPPYKGLTQNPNIDDKTKSETMLGYITNNMYNGMVGILDWVQNTPNINLKQYDWNSAMAAQREYHQNLEAQSLQKKEDNKIIKQYDDGYYWVDLETNRCSEEGEAMGHCASTSAETMLSLRKYTPETQSIEAFVTIAANPDDESWQQAKGKKNSKPKKEYWEYIADILVQYEMLEFKAEYNAANDFTNNDLYSYIENNSDEFENPDELLEKIQENLIPLEDFEKYYNENTTELKYFSMYIDQDGDGEREFVWHRQSVQFDIDLDFFGEYSGNVENYILNLEEGSSELTELINDVTNEYVSYGNYHQSDNIIQIYGDIESDYDISNLDEDGLDNFKRMVNSMVNDDNYIQSKNEDGNYFNEQLQEYLIKEEILPDDDYEYDEEDYKPIPRRDPNQMELDLSKLKIKFKNIFYS
jgi:hypothetical protein